MNSPPAAKATTQASLRRDGEKKGRDFDGCRVVRVVNENNDLVARLDPSREAERIRRLLAAPNATPVRKRDGRLVAIKLESFGDDRGYAGERHGSSTVTTERVRNTVGHYLGSERNLKHKEKPSETWRNLAATVRLETKTDGKASAKSK